MKTRSTFFSMVSLMNKFLFILLLPALLQAAQVGDTLKYRVTYYPTWAYGELDPWNIDWGGMTHVINFTNGSMSQTSPYFNPLVNASDSTEIEFGYSNGATHYLDSLTTICHRKGIKVMESIQCVSGTNFDYVAADSTRTEVFFRALKGWMIRKHIDGWDLDLESGGATNAQRLRFMRIGRRVCYDAAFPDGRALIGIATGRGDEANWTASLVDTIVTFYDMQAYTYQWMWNGSANATWFQTPVGSPSSCGSCEASSLTKDALYGGSSFIDGYVAHGHDRSKFLVGYATSCVTGFTGTDQLSVAWSNSYADNPLFTVEAMTSYGGTWTHDATAKASYIHGTATAGNPMGFSAGTKFFLPFEDSTDMKAGIDHLKSVGAGGVMFYDIYGDRRVNATPNWKKTPYIYTASVYAARLNGGAAPAPVPTITVTPSARSFGNVTVNTTSSEQIYSVCGSNLTPASGNITVTAPTGFQISKTSGSGFASSLICAYTGGVLSTTTIYSHFMPTAVQSYSGSETNIGGGATTQNVAVTGTGVSAATPTLTINPTSRAFGNVIVNTTSAESTYTISGSNLTPASGNITITPPSGYQVSVTSGSGYSSSLNFAYTGSTLSSRTIYMRFSPTAVQSYSGNLTNAGGGATTQNVAISGSGITAPTPTLTVNPSSKAFGNVIVNTTSAESTYTISGSNLTPASGNITITPPSGYQVSVTSGSGFGSSLTVPYTGSNLSLRTIYVRFSPTAVQSYTGTITNAGGGASTQTVTVSGSGITAPTPTLTINPTSRAFGNVIVNTTSAESTYTISGSNLTPASGNITITPPSGYQVSVTSGSGYSSSLTVPYTGSTLSLRTIYVRFSPTAVQSYSGNLTNAGGGATTQNVAVTGTGVSAATPTLTINPTSRAFGNVIVNTTSAESTYTISGSNLTPASGNITITPPSGYQVSVTSGSGYSSSLTVPYAGSTLSSRTIYVRFSPTAVQSYTGTITNAGGGASTQTVTVSGSGITAPTPTLTINPTSLSFGNVITNTMSSKLTYTLTGSNLSPAIDSLTITAPSGFTISTDSSSGFTSSKKIAYISGTLSMKTIYVCFSPMAVQSYSGNLTNAGGSASTQTVAISGSGIIAPTSMLTVNPTSLSFGNVITNTMSSERTYTLTGLHLSPAIDSLTITAPSGFTISTVSGSGFTSSIRIAYTNGILQPVPKIIYVRFSPTAVQSYSDSITNDGGGAATKYVLVSGNGLSNLPLPTGTFIASSDTLPRNGGPVTLTWTSSNASSASINNGIRTVATNGSITRTIRSTTKFILTLSNINGNTSYVKYIYVRPRKPSRNIALYMPSTASSVELTGVEATKANDGDESTRWSSTFIDNQWWQVDLQNITTIDNVTLTWDSSYASQFTISTSLDGLIFTDVVTGYASGADTIELNFDPVNARYVRLNGIQRGTQFGISFFELDVYESSTTSVESNSEVPCSFSLEQNFPNPFNPSTEIGYQLNTTAEVQLIVYNLIGKEIAILVNQVQRAGHHTVTFNANNLASGMYYAKLQADGKSQIRKMMLTK